MLFHVRVTVGPNRNEPSAGVASVGMIGPRSLNVREAEYVPTSGMVDQLARTFQVCVPTAEV